MKIVNGLLDYSHVCNAQDVLLFTGNPVIAGHGGVVMGRGAAKAVRDMYQGIDKAFAVKLQEDRRRHIIFVPVGNTFIGWFKVKHHWRDNADLDLVRTSVSQLRHIAEQRPFHKFHLNYPAVGNGKLSEAEVAPLLQELPDNVVIYR